MDVKTLPVNLDEPPQPLSIQMEVFNSCYSDSTGIAKLRLLEEKLIQFIYV